MSTLTTGSKQKAGTKWHLKGLYLDSCNCDWGCPCQFNAKPTHGNCEGLSAIHITKGNYGAVKLDGLNFIWIGSWPGPIHEGHGRASIYIDDNANDKQFEELSKIITGRAKGSAFDVYGMTLAHFEEPKRVKMTFHSDGIRSRIKAEGVGESQLEPIKNPVTGKNHRISIVLPAGGFESAKMEMASSKVLSVNDATFNFNHESTYGSIQEISWKGSGP
jgi:hypothetical protein